MKTHACYDGTMKRAVLSSLVAGAIAGLVAVACGSDAPPSAFVDAGTDAGIDSALFCSGGQQLCADKCVDFKTDTTHCGGCDNVCLGGDLCCAGRCVKSPACTFAVTEVTSARGNQSGGDWVKLKGAGFTADMAIYIGDGRAPTRMIDPANAIIQTPPGTVGIYDVTIVSASGTSVLRNGFTYVAAGLKLPWQTKKMASVRGEHPGIAVMQDGRVLVAGGTEIPDDATRALTTAEIYTRTTDQVTPAKNAMAVKRWHDAAVTLLDGRVVVAGVADCTANACKTIDVFDPATDTFTPAKALLSEARSDAWGVLLVDGRVMISSASSATVDIYDAVADTVTAVPLKVIHKFGLRIVRLRDGRVMVIGGDGGQTATELWDPKTGVFTLAGAMVEGRSMFTAHTLPDGRVMVVGGSSISAGAVNAPMKGIEAYDPKTDTWTKMTYGLSVGRTWHASALVRDGTILAMGGYTTQSCTPSDSVDQVDPVKGTVVTFGTLPNPNTEWNAVTLLDGSVLGVGGGACGGNALPDLDFLPGEPLPN